MVFSLAALQFVAIFVPKAFADRFDQFDYCPDIRLAVAQ